jgi:hypothetical protein
VVPKDQLQLPELVPLVFVTVPREAVSVTLSPLFASE